MTRCRLAVLCLSVLLLWAGTPTTALAELTIEEERGVQIAAMSTGYAFGGFHTTLSVLALADGQPMDRSWVGGSFMSAISFVGLSLGYFTQAVAFAEDPNVAVAYGMSVPPGLILGALNLGFAIDSIARGPGEVWMEPGPAVVTLVHGLTLSVLGWVLSLAGNSARGDLENILPIYTWAVGGALLAVFSALSLFSPLWLE